MDRQWGQGRTHQLPNWFSLLFLEAKVIIGSALPGDLGLVALRVHVCCDGLHLLDDYLQWMIIRLESALLVPHSAPPSDLWSDLKSWEVGTGSLPDQLWSHSILTTNTHTRAHAWIFISMKSEERCPHSPCQLAVWMCVRVYRSSVCEGGAG